jgi:hypothetical protein
VRHWIANKITQQVEHFPQLSIYGGLILLIILVCLLLLALTNPLQRGLIAHYYRHEEWSDDSPVMIANERTIDLRRWRSRFPLISANFSIEWSGIIFIPIAGEYQFSTISDDGSILSIDNQVVVDNGGFHYAQERTGTIHLEKGFHALELHYRQGTLLAEIKAYWTPPDQKRQPLSAAPLFRTEPTATELALGNVMEMLFTLCVLLCCIWAVVAILTGLSLLSAEECVYLVSLILLAVTYLLSLPSVFSYLVKHGVQLPAVFFGFDQLRYLGDAGVVTWGLLTLCAILLYRSRISWIRSLVKTVNAKLSSKNILFFLIPVFAIVLFFVFRSEFLNPDGWAFLSKVPRDVPEKGAHFGHDEMWESYLHSRFWLYTNTYFNWSVKLSYQVLSSLAGGVFFLLLLFYSRLLFPKNSIPFVLLCISGGFMQLFFGDVEHYTLTGAAIFAYFVSSALYLKARQSIVVPSAILSLAMTLHLVAGFFLPSLVFLYVLELKKKKYIQICYGVSAFLVIFGLTLFFFHTRNFPFQNLFTGTWASKAFGDLKETRAGGINTRMWAIPASKQYYWEQLNLLFLMFPANLLVVPLLWFKRVKMDRFNGFLIIAAVVKLLFQFTYRAQLGVYSDWNLYANVAIPLSIFVWYNMLKIPRMKYKAEILIACFSLSFLHSYCWIISNHFWP